MNPERQRIAIAEACGWKRDRPNIIRSPSNVFRRDARTIHKGQLPDYLNDLNAMHEADMTLSPTPDELQICHGRYTGYLRNLCKVCGYPEDERALFAWPIVAATAAQRAEAFLRTLNLWENES